MKKNHYIITGTSRGIGEAIAWNLMGDDNVLHCISRNTNPRLTNKAGVKGWKVYDYALDLNEASKINELIHKIFRNIWEEDVRELILINNAGIVNPIREIGDEAKDEAIIRNVTVNLTAAMLVTDGFVRETQDWKCPRKVLNMSTGAARRPLHGWSAYCASKAGLEMYAQNLTLEQADKPHPVKVVSFSPGVVDTEMQQEIRHADPENFPDLERFKNYKDEGMLLNPKLVASTVIDVIQSEDFGKETLVSIRDII